jgi:hypothetical protein
MAMGGEGGEVDSGGLWGNIQHPTPNIQHPMEGNLEPGTSNLEH